MLSIPLRVPVIPQGPPQGHPAKADLSEPFAIGVGDTWGFCGRSVGAVFKMTHYACTWQHFRQLSSFSFPGWGTRGDSVEVLLRFRQAPVLVLCGEVLCTVEVLLRFSQGPVLVLCGQHPKSVGVLWGSDSCSVGVQYELGIANGSLRLGGGRAHPH